MNTLSNRNLFAVTPLAFAPWQTEWAAGYRDASALLADLQIDPARLPSPLVVLPFPLRVPYSYVARMRIGDPLDPLLRQVLPVVEETTEAAEFVDDPVGDGSARRAPGVLHKYQGRALLITSGACAIHCRYCFRRNFPYAEHTLSRSTEDQALAYITADHTITEVILSGGDPLALVDERLAVLVERLARIPHLRRLRVHTRTPVALPSRVTPALLELLTNSRLTVVVVLHCNHPNELAGDFLPALAALREARLTLLNQSVLLRGVNDQVDALCQLSEDLFDLGVTPYYLHLLDRARGTAHFEVPVTEAHRLHDALRRRLPGYLVPRLVRETAGAPYKLPL